MRSILIHAWTVHKNNSEYFLPYSHWVYLKEIVKYYDDVCLLSPVMRHRDTPDTGLVKISSFEAVRVYELPYSNGYISATKYFFSYLKAYRVLPYFDVVYARYPIPFGWLQKRYFKKSKRIIHFVGDPVDTIRNNPNLSEFKKRLLVALFLPEHNLYLRACRTATVYTNGMHIANKLKREGIIAKPLISSTLNDEDFYLPAREVSKISPKILYVGYLRKAKGVDTVLKSFALLQKTYPSATLTIVGTGELEDTLRISAGNENITGINFLGHIDDRTALNNIFRSHDIFCFASLSEGSPRVVLEAMANGIVVVSTPVGSLPHAFTADSEIIFSEFTNHQQFAEKMELLISDKELYNRIQLNAFEASKKYTINNFLKEIFR